jgi:hypothetical protein
MTISRSFVTTSALLGLLSVGGCASSSMSGGGGPAPDRSAVAPTPDPRVGLHAGWMNAGEAYWNLSMVSHTDPSAAFINLSTPGDRRLVNSDLAFTGNLVIQGNYSGYQVWDISIPKKPTLATSYVCPGSQSDVSVYKNLLFVSAEATNGRTDCGLGGVADTVSQERARGIRIYDITDIKKPVAIKIVQTCRGSHTHTVVTDPKDPDDVYIYVSGSASVRSPTELAGCVGATDDPNTALFRIEVIKVPLAHPEQAAIVTSPRIFADSAGNMNGLTLVARHAESAEDQAAAAKRAEERAKLGLPPRPQLPRGITQCHDITVYPAIGLAGGACGGMGLLLDIRDVAHPVRIGAVADSNMSFWHSATFSNDGSKVLFSDEWGGGTQPRCRKTDKMEWGADALFTRDGSKMTFTSYYKMPAPQTSFENCVAHNGSLIPIPGRDVMVQAWYQGGISVFDWTDPMHPKEIAFFDRGPMDSTKMVDGGYWSAYWYNGFIVGSEISRGLDLFELKPSPLLSKNEIEAAKLVHFDFLNVQDQPKLVWPVSFVVARAYLDQLVRDHGIASERSSQIASSLDRAEHLKGTVRQAALADLATQLDGDASSAGDPAKVKLLAGEVRDLASAGQ